MSLLKYHPEDLLEHRGRPRYTCVYNMEKEASRRYRGDLNIPVVASPRWPASMPCSTAELFPESGTTSRDIIWEVYRYHPRHRQRRASST